MNLLIKSAKIVDSQSEYNGKIVDILIENGSISEIAQSIEKSDFEILELDDLHVSPGWFDTSVSFGEPGYEDRETIENGLKTAAKSGFTAVALNPNCSPKVDNKSLVEFLINKANNSSVSLYPIGNLTHGGEGKDISEMFDMKNSGAIAFGDYMRPISNPNLMKIALQYAQNFNGLIMSYPEDTSIARDGLVNEGESSIKLGLKGIPALAEELQIQRDLFLLEYTGGKLHIPTISTKKSLELIKAAKDKGLQVTCSVSAHHLTLTDLELASFDSNVKIKPPLRTKTDTEALIAGVESGVIDVITSDHNPIDIENKKLEFNFAKFGTIGLESLFGALNSEIKLEKLIECLTVNSRKVFNLSENKIELNQKANLTFFTPKGNWTFEQKDILSTSKNGIFLGKEMNGKVYGTLTNSTLTLNK